jgi:hypothetical protein
LTCEGTMIEPAASGTPARWGSKASSRSG